MGSLSDQIRGAKRGSSTSSSTGGTVCLRLLASPDRSKHDHCPLQIGLQGLSAEIDDSSPFGSIEAATGEGYRTRLINFDETKHLL